MAKRNAVGAKGARLLRRVAKHILAEPLRYEQNTIVDVGRPGEVNDYVPTHQPFAQCGTMACIGGWVALLSGKSSENASLEFARTTLGITIEQAGHLFAGIDGYLDEEGEEGWPPKFRHAYLSATTPRKCARIAAQRIEHFIKTGE